MSYNKPLMCVKHGTERVYHVDRHRPSGKALVCLACVHDHNVKYNIEMTPERRRELNDRRNAKHNSAYHRKHNIKHHTQATLEEIEALEVSQGNLCAICGQPEIAKNQYGIKHLAVDHNHITGKLRGLLCSSCNMMVGKAHDNPDTLEAAARYLRLHY